MTENHDIPNSSKVRLLLKQCLQSPLSSSDWAISISGKSSSVLHIICTSDTSTKHVQWQSLKTEFQSFQYAHILLYIKCYTGVCLWSTQKPLVTWQSRVTYKWFQFYSKLLSVQKQGGRFDMSLHKKLRLDTLVSTFYWEKMFFVWAKHVSISVMLLRWRADQWRIQKFWEGKKQKTTYQSHRHLSQMHTTNYRVSSKKVSHYQIIKKPY